MDNKIISVIVPIKITSFRKDIFERLTFCHRAEAQDVEYIIVDDGSSNSNAELLKKRCIGLGYKYISTNISNENSFNLARVRNKAAKEAKGKYLLFLDVDLLVYPGFYDDINTEIELFDLEHNSDKFLMFPVIYLNNHGMETYNKQKEYLKKHLASQIMIEGKFNLIEKYSYGTSCILVDRLYYLSIGGQNEYFEGWGYEDYEFTTKMMKLSSTFITPPKYTSMKGNFMSIKRYTGWKAEYRLYGMWMARKGIYLYHVPHEVDLEYKVNEKNNLKLLKKSLANIYENDFIQTIEPNSEKSLLLSNNPFCCHYKLNPLLGNYEIFDIKKISNWEEIKKYYIDNNFTQIVFPNPYGNPILLDLYNYCRKQNIKYIISERGALPGSVYHDRNGFLYDSTSYNIDKWDFALDDIQEIQIKNYISTLRNGNETLEKQPSKLTRDKTLSKLDIDNKNRKKILIILQTKNDTVIKFFGRNFKTQSSLKTFIEKIISISNDKFKFIYKNHPLEPTIMKIDGAINADDYHINDLIDICDGVLTINSGAGLIAALLGKPVFTLGDCWYTLPEIACDILNENDFLSKVDFFEPSEEKLLRFAYYLRYNFYSFGKHHTVIHTKKDSIINATLKIDYTEVQTLNHHRIFYRDKDYKIGFDSILFKEYEEESLLFKKSFKERFLFKIQKYKKLDKLINNPKSFFKDSKFGLFRIISKII